ncbi:MAG: LOG family protein [Prevotella sp.]|nr:LOG family protein [Prevotella sp.]
MITRSYDDDVKVLSQWMKDVPFEVIRYNLYNAQDLYNGYEPSADEAQDRASFDSCYDSRVLKHFTSQGKIATNLNESLSRTLHDHSIYLSLLDFTKTHNPERCVGLMGGHAILRTDPMYERVVLLSKRLTEEGFFMVSGGGPGAMEATHLGAWLAGRTEGEAKEAIALLKERASTVKDPAWLSSALDIMKRYPQTKYESLGVPTWLYGHEPSTPFATHIAKFFENSIREQVILTISFGGIVYTPGSAGTLQEIFQEAVQNHYLSNEISSPMIFLGKKFWTEEVPVYRLIEHLIEKGRYKNLKLTLTDDTDEIEMVLKDFQNTL